MPLTRMAVISRPRDIAFSAVIEPSSTASGRASASSAGVRRAA